MSTKNENEWKLNQQAQEFFVYTTLGIVPQEIFNTGNYAKMISNYECLNNTDVNYKVYCIFMCTKAAYNDLSRTLRYKEEYKSNSKDKNALNKKEQILNRICAELTKKIYNNGSITSNPENLFDVLVDKQGKYSDCVNDLFVCLKEDEKDNLKFHFGQVQKWINMTLKYLYLLGIVENDNKLHIPIDNYIINAFKQNDIFVPRKAWSRFDNTDYYDQYKSYMDKLDEPYIDWEHKTWIEQAEKEKGIKFN